MAGKFHLLTSFWDPKDEKREQELVFCLQKNLENPLIEKIHILWDELPSFKNPIFDNPKINNLSIYEYPSYNTFIQYANSNLAGEKVIIANSDIFFDNSLELILKYDFSDKVLALTRYNLEEYISNKGSIWERNYGSQDAWIFSSPLELDEKNFPLIKMGYCGCDGWFAHELDRAGKKVLNPSEDIKIWHVHEDNKFIPDLFLHKKSYFYHLFDSTTKNPIRYKYLPVEPLARWKIYTIYSESHEVLYKNWFLRTMKDDFEVIPYKIEQSCESANYYENGWVDAVLNKIPIILKAIDSAPENGFFIFSDVDVQFFSPIQNEIKKILSEKPQVDIFFQKDALGNGLDIAYFCTGFFICKSNKRTRKFWELVGEAMKNKNIGDQASVNNIIAKKLVPGLQTDFLPLSFWNINSGVYQPQKWLPGDDANPPLGILLHHANWTVGVPNKIALLEHVLREVNSANPIFSIQIPIYNAEKYLIECLDSVLQQTFTNFEVICVDDGSTDNSLSILNEYAKKDQRFRIYKHKTNRGTLQARKTAFCEAKGKYMVFVDADDIAYPTMLEEFYNRALETSADFIQCGAEIYDPEDIVKPETLYELQKHYNSVPNLKPFVQNTFTVLDKEVKNNLWLSIVHRSVYKKIIPYIPDQPMLHGNDNMLIFLIAFFSQRYATLDKVLYKYRVSVTSSNILNPSAEEVEEHIKSRSDMLKSIRRFLKKTDLNWDKQMALYSIFSKKAIGHVKKIMKKCITNHPEEKKKLEGFFKKYFPEYNIIDLLSQKKRFYVLYKENIFKFVIYSFIVLSNAVFMFLIYLLHLSFVSFLVLFCSSIIVIFIIEAYLRIQHNIDNKINSVDNKINSVDNKINSVDNKINSVDNKINSVDNKINSSLEESKMLLEEATNHLDKIITEKIGDINNKLTQVEKNELELAQKTEMQAKSISLFYYSYVKEKRAERLLNLVPDIFHHKSVLYVGARPDRTDFLEEFQKNGYEITILEIYKPNVEYLRSIPWVKDVKEGDISSFDFDKKFDVVFWWHGPEHIKEEKIRETLRKIELIANHYVVLGCPWGKVVQGKGLEKNPFEEHVSFFETGYFEKFGYKTDYFGIKDKFGSNIISVKKI